MVIEIFFLSVLQGITEFLPVSSSSHLILISEFFIYDNQNLSIDVSLHIGSFLAVLVYFKNDIFDFVKNKELLLKIIISSFPVMIVGYLLIKFNLISLLRNVEIIGWMTIIFGIILYVSDKFKCSKKIEKNFSYNSAIFIGFIQILSLVPGVSRSGVTISAARILNFKRVDSAKISFLLSIPTLAAVSFFGLNNIFISEDLNFSMMNVLSIFLSFFFSLITIKFFLKYMKKFSLNIFVIYRIILGTIILVTIYL